VADIFVYRDNQRVFGWYGYRLIYYDQSDRSERYRYARAKMSADQVLGAVVLLTMLTILSALLIGQWQAGRDNAKKTAKQ
jgi:hypothetical protein